MEIKYFISIFTFTWFDPKFTNNATKKHFFQTNWSDLECNNVNQISICNNIWNKKWPVFAHRRKIKVLAWLLLHYFWNSIAQCAVCIQCTCFIHHAICHLWSISDENFLDWRQRTPNWSHAGNMAPFSYSQKFLRLLAAEIQLLSKGT